ncbi:MAG: ribosomal subunit interface protein [Piscirickettsiaceae bacterium]|nr:MAG: ribosomal subunit interface protein [Piscirickettsiaceae bacterium]PCI70595.1 MAG: ribosomal subunit interface protein [Piscirickettsiaceae bacterium]
MQLSLSGHHVEITDAIRDYTTGKFEKIKRHFDKVIDVHVILTVEKLEQKAEATIQLNGNKIFAEDTQENMYAAIDSLVDKLDRQVRKHKEKLATHR